MASPVSREEYENLLAAVQQLTVNQAHDAQQRLVQEAAQRALDNVRARQDQDRDRRIQTLENRNVRQEQQARLNWAKIGAKSGSGAIHSVAVWSVHQGTKSAFVKKLAQSGLKKEGMLIPGISLLFGIGAAIFRWKNGDSGWKVFLEIFSGITGCVPGTGTLLSLGIDGFLVYKDMNSSQVPPLEDLEAMREAAQDRAADLAGAYNFFGFESGEGYQEPTRDQIDARYRDLMQALHPDHVNNNPLADRTVRTETTVLLNQARNLIYAERGW